MSHLRDELLKDFQTVLFLQSQDKVGKVRVDSHYPFKVCDIDFSCTGSNNH